MKALDHFNSSNDIYFHFPSKISLKKLRLQFCFLGLQFCFLGLQFSFFKINFLYIYKQFYFFNLQFCFLEMQFYFLEFHGILFFRIPWNSKQKKIKINFFNNYKYN